MLACPLSMPLHSTSKMRKSDHPHDLRPRLQETFYFADKVFAGAFSALPSSAFLSGA